MNARTRFTLRSFAPVAALLLLLGAGPASAQFNSVAQIGQNKIGTVTDNGGGSYTIVGGGNDIWDQRDELTFAYTEVTGDFDLRVRVESVTFNATWSKAGIMARESLSEYSRMLFPRVTPDAGANDNRFAYRTGLDNNAGVNGGQHEDCTDCEAQRPGNGQRWVRLVRAGNVFTASSSPDGSAWTLLGAKDTADPAAWGAGPMPKTLFVGLGVGRHSGGPTATAEFRNIQFTYAASLNLVGASSRGNPNGVRVSATQAVPLPDALNPAIYSLTSPSAGTIVTGLRFTSANDAQERDPMTFTLEGTTGDPTTGPWTMIASGNTGLPTTRRALAPDVLFANTAAYTSYRLRFPTVRDAGVANSMQISEVAFLDAAGNDVTSPGDPVIPSSVNHPVAEAAPMAIDNNSATKYLNLDKLNTGFNVTPSRVPPRVTVVTGARFTSANDAPERDPMTFTLEGKTGGDDTPWSLIASGNTGLSTTRNTAGPIVTFANSIPYSRYRVLFPTVRTEASANSMQVAEIELLNASSTDITSPADNVIGVRAIAGGGASETAVVGTTGGANNYPAAESPDKTVDNNTGSKYLNFAKINTGVIITPAGGSTPTATVLAASAVPGRPDQVQLTTTGLAEGATYVVSVPPLPGLTPAVFVHGAGFEGRRIRITHNKTDDAGYYPISDAVTKGIGDLGTMVGGGTYPAVDNNNVFEDPTVDNGENERFSTRISGVLNVTATGNHTFACSSDDIGRLYLSSNDDPASKTQIAMEPQWNGSRQYAVTDRRNATTPENRSSPLPLTAGNRYYLEYIFTEGGGGNNGSAAWAPPGSTVPIPNGASPVLETAFVPSRLIDGNTFYRLGTVVIVQHPASQSVPTPNAVTFSVRVDGTPNYRYQWQRKRTSDPDFSTIAGATGPSYTQASTDISLDNGAQFRAIANNEFSSATSAVATLTVTIDLTPPSLVSCVNVAGSDTSFDLAYSEPVNTTDAQNLANYSINGGVTLNTATLQGDLRTVRFTCSSLATFTCKTLTVSNIKDRSNQQNVLPANSVIGVIHSTRNALVHRFDGISGVLVDDLLNNPAFPNAPTFVGTVAEFEYSPNLENYGARVMALLTPQVSGNYTFYISADDGAALWLSTDISPANKVRIANEPIWAAARQWTGAASGGGRSCPSATACNISAPINLQGGCKYYLEMIYKEQGGGDYGAVAWRTPANGPAPNVPANGSAPIPGTYLSAFLLPATIVTDIQNVTISCGRRVTFSPVVIGTPPLAIQWFRNGMAIPGANGTSYTTDTLTGVDSGVTYYFTATTTAPAGMAESHHAVVTVTPDITPPTLLSVAGSPSFDTVTLVFSEILDAASAGDTISYTVTASGGGAIGLNAATLQADGRTVVLNTTPQTPNTVYDVAVNNNLSDYCGNLFVNATVSFRSHVVACAGLVFETFNTGGGVAVADLTNNVNFPNNPDSRRIMNLFDTRAELGTDNFRDNFGARLRGVFVPPSSGNWIFYLHSDDAAQLWVNPTGPNPAGRVLVVEETTCCRDWPTVASSAVALTAGTACYIEGLYKEGGGGDYIRVAARLQGSADALVAIPLEQLGRVTAPGAAGTLTITTQPVSVTIPENSVAIFTVAATPQFSYQQVCYQWQRKDPGGISFVEVPGATAATLTVDPTTFAPDNGAQYRCLVSMVGVETASAVATLNLIPDTVGPAVLSAAGSDSFDLVTLLFNERLDISSANDAVNYSIPGLSVLSASIGADQRTVTLTTSPQADSRLYTAIVSGVRDRIGNSIGSSNFASFISFVISCSGPLMETYDTTSAPGTAVSLLTSHPNFPNIVRDRYVLAAFNSRGGYPDDSHEQYGGRIRGLFVPPVSGSWIFYLSSDDASQLFLNPNGPGSAGKQMLTEEVGCCNPFAAHASLPVSLVAGQRYYIEALWKEGGGGDYCQVAAKLDTDPTDPNALPPIPGSRLLNPPLPPGYGGAVNITLQPVNATVPESSPAAFTVSATTTGGLPLCYQWQRKNLGAPDFTDIPGAMGAILTISAATLPADHQAQFRCVVGVAGTKSISAAATLSVTPDTTRPAIASVGSMLGATIGVCFSELVEATSAQDAVNYTVNGGAVAVNSVTLRPDGRSVSLAVTGLGAAPGTPFTVTANGVLDRAQVPNVSASSRSGTVLGLASADLGNPGDPQSPSQFFACSVEVTTGGSDIWNNQDGFHFDYTPRTGNFDVRVRVESLVAANVWSKAGLMARENLSAGSRNLHAIVDPPPVPALDGSGNGANTYEANYRDVQDMGTGNWPGGVNGAAPQYPNAWIRLARYNNVFTAYRSTDGINWTQMAQTTQTYPATIFVGLCTTAHSLSFLTTAVYQDLAFAPAPLITQQPAGGSFQCSSNVVLSVTATGDGPITYQWRKAGVDVLGATASTLSFNPATMANNGAYDVIVTGAGGSVTSLVASVTIADTIGPVIACGMNQSVPCGTAWSFATASATDGCDLSPVLTIFSTTTNTTCGSAYVATRVWRAVDASANVSFCTQAVSVVDTIAPVASCPANITRYCNGPLGAQVSFSASASDACQGAVVPVCLPPSGAFFAVGSNVVQCVATDACGNSNTCSFAVIVLPNPAPVWATVANFSATTTPSEPRSLRGLALSHDEKALFLGLIEGSSSASVRSVNATNGAIIATVTLDPGRQPHAVAADDRGYVYAGASIPSGTPDGQFQIFQGTNLALVNVLTPSGTARVGGLSVRRVGATYYLYVARQSPTAATIQRFNVTDPMLVSFDLTFGVSGTFDVRTLFPAAASLRGLDVSDDGTLFVADGDNDVVYRINNTLSAGLSAPVAEAMDVALHDDKVYVTRHDGANSAVVVLRASDLTLGGTLQTGIARDTFEGYSGIDVSLEGRLFVADQVYSNAPVTVVQDRVLASTPMATNLSITCPAPLAIQCGSAVPPGATTQAQFESAGGVVPCQAVSISFGDGPLTPGPLTGTVARTYMAVDSFGNSASCIQTITIQDTIAPAITCPANLASNITTLVGTVMTYTTPTATDVCGPAPTVLCVPASGSVFPIGNTTVTCTATDATGHTTPCQFTVSVQFCHSTNYTVNATVPDNNINGLASTKTFVSPLGVMSDVNVSLTITGGFNGDLYAYLVHDSGFAVLLNRVGRTALAPLGYGDAGFNVTLDDQAAADIHNYRFTLFGNHTTPLAGPLTNAWQPDARSADPFLVLDSDTRSQYLTNFNGLNPNGDWTLFVADLSGVDIASVASWGLEICGSFPVPLAITAQSSNTTAQCSSNVTFSVTTTGTSPKTNQWYRNTVAITGATAASYTVTNAHPADAGTYAVVVCNMTGCVTSAPIALTIIDTNPPLITTCAPGLTNCAGVSGMAPVPDFAVLTVAADACSSVTITQSPLAGTLVAIGTTPVLIVVRDAANNSNGCSAVLTVAGPPTITAQPQSQTVPMGNGAVFSVTASSVQGAPTYQWQTNGANVGGATASSLALSNLTLANSGTLIRVLVSNCAGSVTSAVAVLTVTPLSGISFDFNTPGQFSNSPYATALNNWMNSALPAPVFESPTGGVGTATGNGVLDLAVGSGDNGSTLLPLTYDFSLTGKTLYASAMIKIKVPTANGRSIQMAFVTATNAGNAWQQVNANNGQGFMSIILQSTTQPAVTYQLRAQHKVVAGTTAIETIPVNTPTNVLNTNTWYKLVAKFVNVKDVGTLSSNFTVEATLQDMGATGLTPGAIVLGLPPLLQTNLDMVNASRMLLSVRAGSGDAGGSDYWDNLYVHTTNGPVFFVASPQSQSVAHGRPLRLQALVDGDGPYAYQWQKSNSGAGFVNLAGATAWNLVVPAVSSSDHQAHYRVVVNGASGSATSVPARVTVVADALDVVSAGSVDGCTVGIRFDQAVDPVTAANPANYLINGLPAIAARVYQSPTDLRHIVQDGSRVVVTPAAMFAGAFTVSVSGVRDVSGTVIGGTTSAAGTVAGLTGEEVNPYVTAPTGQQYSFATGQFEVSGGGADIFGNADSFHYLYRVVSGDFDVKARIAHSDLLRFTNRVGFAVRASLDPFSPQVLAAVNPQLPGKNTSDGVVRPAYNVASTLWGSSTVLSYPDVWLRLRRVGNTYMRYVSTNGANWQLDGQLTLNPALPDSVYLGLAVCGLANGNLATAWVENYGAFAGYPGAIINITQQPINVTTSAPNAALLTAVATLTGGGAPAGGELAYTWQRTNSASGGWTNMPTAGATNNILNTGALFASDNGAQYRVIVSAAGALSVTSVVATVTVTDTGLPTITAGHVPTNAVRNIVLIYSEPMAASALSTANYAVTNGAGTSFGVTAAIFLHGDPRVVQLTTANDLVPGPYGVLVNNVRDLNNNAIAANTVRLVFQMGFGMNAPFVAELYGGLTAGGAITDLVNNIKFAGGDVRYSFPELINYSNVFGINGGAAAFPDTLNAYGVRMYSWFVPPTNGAYKFYLRGDDFVQFWMNTNPATSTLPPDGVIATSNSITPMAFNSPVAQQAMHAIDNNINTKYLNFNFLANPGLTVTPAMGPSVVTGLRFTTAEDAIERDPTSFTLEGTTGSPATGQWVFIASGATGLATNRLTTGPTINFPNSTAYTSYRLLLPTTRNTGNSGVPTTPNSMQISEIEFLDAGGQDVTGRGALRQVELTANNANYTAINSVTNTLVAGQRYFVELRFKETGGGDGGAVQVRNDNTVPGAIEVAPGSLFQFPAPFASSTPVQIELYAGLVQANPIGAGRIEDLFDALTQPQVIAGVPSVTGFGKHFGYSTNLANTSFDNYFGKLYANYIAPSNGLYKFYMRSDDSSQLWMNTNTVNSTDPSGMRLLGGLERFLNVNYWLVAENVSLNSGQRYYMEGRWREGGGGDGLSVVVRSQGDATTPRSEEMMPASQLELATNTVRYGPVRVSGITPLNPTVNVGEPIIFQAVGVSGTPPYGFQWLKNGVQVMANNPIYTNPPVTSADNGAVFTLVVTNLFSRAEVSSVVTVPVDNTPPTLASAVGSQYQEFVTVTFNGPVDPTSAACLANYRVNNGVTVLSVAYDGGQGKRVSLRTTPQTPGTVYTVTVNGVKDRAGNLIAANSMINFTAWTWGGCGFLVELFTNITGGAVLNLTADGKYANNLPDVTYYTNLFGAGRFAADSGLNNYGARVSAYALPPATGLYRFYIRGDDGTMLFMNTNGPDARGRVMIARNDGANSGTYSNGVGNGIVGASISPVISLTNGTAYYIEALMKEGGGGDHLEVVFRPVDGTGTGVPPAPATPAAADLSPLFATSFAAPGNPDAVQLVISQSPPTDLFVMEHDLVDLRLVAGYQPPSAVWATCYQWQRETGPGSGVFTNIPGAVNQILPTFSALLSQNNVRYRLIASLPVPRVFTTTLHVTADGTGPRLVGASSLDGTNLHLCFNEPIDRPSGTAEDTAQYEVNSGAATVLSAVLRTNDERTVILSLAAPISGRFTVTAGAAGGLQDLSVNFGVSSATGVVQNLQPADVGAPPGPGSSFSCKEGEIDVIAGGADIWGASDQGHMVLRPVCGDFDMWTRVQRLDRAPLDNDGITKAGLMVRESWAPDARKLHVLLEPPATVGGREFFEAGRRRAVGGGDTIAWDGGTGNTLIMGRASIPNGWVRIKRTGNRFEAFRSEDGVSWSLATTNNVILSNVVYVGLAATAHIPSPSAATTFAEFRNLHLPFAPTITVPPAPTDQTVGILTPITWTVTATNPPNAGPLTYQWQRNGNSIPGATGPSYTIPGGASVAAAGLYTVVVGNDGGCVSASVNLNVVNGAPVVTGEMLMATQNVNSAVSAGTLLANDTDPEFQPLGLLGVSGGYPGLFSTDFNNNQVPAGSALYGTPLADPGAHVGDDGSGTNSCIHLTDLGNFSAYGAYVVDDLGSGKTVNQLHVRWRQRIGGALNNAIQLDRPGADGMALSWGADVPAVPGNIAHEEGMGTGLIVAFDTWDNTTAESSPSPGIEIKWGGLLVSNLVAFDNISADQRLAKDFLRKDRFVDASLTVTPDGRVTLVYDGMTVAGILPGFNGIAGGRLAWAGRTGGAFDNHWIDDVSVVALTRDTSLFSSGNAFPTLTNSFSGGLSSGSILLGTPVGAPSGVRVADDGTGTNQCVHLTDQPSPSATGLYYVPDQAGGQVVNTIDIRWRALIGGGTNGGTQFGRPGADGISLNWANDLPGFINGTFYEDGVGGGLSFTIDTWDNGGLESPGIEIKWRGARVAFDNINADQGLAKDFLRKNQFVNARVTVDATGLATFTYDGRTITAQLPGWTGIVNGRFMFAGRTGSAWDNHWIDDLSIAGTTASYGRVGLSGGVVTYTPPTNGCGMDRYYYVVTDGQQRALSGLSVGQVDVQIKESVAQAPIIALCATNRTIGLTNSCTLAAPDLRGQLMASDNCCCLLYSQTPAPGTALALGSHLFTFVATDTMGLSATCTATVVVQDIAPPQLTCPANVTVECMSGSSAIVAYAVPTPTDNCSSTVLCVPPSGSVFALGATVVTCTAMDPSANSTNCQFTVTVADTIAPAVVCQSNIVVLLGAGQCDAVVTYQPPTFMDCSTNLTVMCSPASGTLFHAGTNTVNCSVIDGSANSGLCSFRIAVLELVPPLVTCPPDQVVACGSPTTPPATGTASATDNCDTNVAVTFADGTVTEVTATGQAGWALSIIGGPPTSTAGFAVGPSTPPLGTGSLRLTVGTDGDSLAQARITNYHGVRLSALTELAFRTWVSSNNGNGETIYLTLNVDSDNNGTADDLLVFEPEFQSGYTPSVPNQGPVTLGTWQSWDAFAGGWWSLNQPGIMSPGAGVKRLSAYFAAFPNARIANTGAGAGGVRLVAGNGIGGWENFDGYVDRFTIGSTAVSAMFDFDSLAGSAYTGIVRTWTGMDDSGNRTACSQLIRVVDLVAPAITCSTNRVVEANGVGGASVSYVTTTVDACDPSPVLVCTPASNAFFPMGPTTVNCVSTDNRGNSNQCSFLVTVIDTTAPNIVCSTNRLVQCVGPAGAPATYVVIAMDVNDANPVVVCVPPSGSTFPRGTNTVMCSATDASMNVGTCSFTVTVADTNKPVITACAPNQNVPANANCEGVVPNLSGQITASDLCGGVTITQVPAVGSVFTLSTVVTLTVTDAAGNSTNCTTMLTAVDQTPPIIACPANFTAECATPAGTAVNYSTVAADNCTASPVVTCSPVSGSVFAPGSNTVTCVARDAANNSNSCSFVIHVIDTTDPSVCSGPALVQSAGGTNDNFTGIEAASPSQNLQDVLIGLDPFRGFDDASSDKWFAHSLSGLPDDISDAILRIRLRADAGSSTNDTIELLFSTPGGGSLPQDWIRRIGTNSVDGVPGLRPGLWTPGSQAEIVLDLSSLPNANNTTTDLIPTLRAQRYLDIIVQNATMIDYVILEVRSCQCQPDIQVNAAAMACGANVNFASPVFTDNCDTNIAVVCTPASGSFFAIGTTTVECRGTDDSGNVGRCSFNVTVVESAPALAIQVSGNSIVVSWPITCANYHLQETSSLNPVIAWSNVGAPVFINMGRYTVTLPIQPGNRFFRLVSP